MHKNECDLKEVQVALAILSEYSVKCPNCHSEYPPRLSVSKHTNTFKMWQKDDSPRDLGSLIF